MLLYLYHKVDVLFLYHIFRLTNPDGRYTNFIQKADFTAGRYKLHFDVDRYFELRKLESLYPFIEVAYLFIYLLT
jgi:5-hydroxyisourate hydrolase